VLRHQECARAARGAGVFCAAAWTSHATSNQAAHRELGKGATGSGDAQDDRAGGRSFVTMTPNDQKTVISDRQASVMPTCAQEAAFTDARRPAMPTCEVMKQ